MDAYLPEIHHFVKQHESLSEAFAHAWCEANENMLAFVEAHPSWCCQLKYEDLVANPVDEMNRLFAFLDLDPCAQDLVDGALESAEGAGLGDWKTYEASQVHARQVGRHESLDGWTKKRLAPMVDPMLKRLDYDTVHVSDTDRQQDPLRAQELARAVAAMKMTGSSPADPDG